MTPEQDKMVVPEADVFRFNEARYAEGSYPEADIIRLNTMVSLAGRNKKVLDLGCLDGFAGELLMKHGNEVHGVDASAPAVEKAKERGVKAVVGNLERDLEFEDESFDVVFAGEIIEHVYAIDRLISEARRVLRPDGCFVLSTPNLAAFGRRMLLLLNMNPHIEISYSGGAAGHIRYFIRSTLVELLGKHGFEVEQLTSDVVNLNASGSIRLRWLAQCCPSLGRSLIVRAVKVAPGRYNNSEGPDA